MNCNEFESVLPELLYDELDHQQTCAAREHLSSCPRCSAQHAELAAVVQSLDRWKEPTTDVSGENAAWIAGELERAREPRHGPRALKWRPVLTGMAAAVVAFCLLTWTGASTGVGSDGFFVDFGRPPASSPQRAEQPVRAGQFLLLLLGNDSDAETRKLREGRNLVREYSDWAQGLQRDELLLAAEKLSDHPGHMLSPSHTGAALSDITTEADVGRLEGFFAIAADDFDEATAIARSCPHLKYGGRIFIRQIEKTTGP